MVPDDDGNRKVSCRCEDLKGDGVYEVADKHLVLRSNFGTHKALLGLQKPRRVARRLLKNICTRESVKEPDCEVSASDSAGPRPAPPSLACGRLLSATPDTPSASPVVLPSRDV